MTLRQRLNDVCFHRQCLAETCERLQAAGRAMKVRIEAVKHDLTVTDRKLAQTRRVSDDVSKARPFAC